MLLGQRMGLDPTVLAGVINSSTGGCWASSVNNPVPFSLPGKSPPSERDFEGGFATALMLKVRAFNTTRKNLQLVLQIGHGTGQRHRKAFQQSNSPW